MTIAYFIIGTVFLALGILCLIRAIQFSIHKSDMTDFSKK
jgi:hypothetical protein